MRELEKLNMVKGLRELSRGEPCGDIVAVFSAGLSTLDDDDGYTRITPAGQELLDLLDGARRFDELARLASKSQERPVRRSEAALSFMTGQLDPWAVVIKPSGPAYRHARTAHEAMDNAIEEEAGEASAPGDAPT